MRSFLVSVVSFGFFFIFLMGSGTPVAALCNIPSSTDYVFVGESGLDLTRAGVRAGTDIAWWMGGITENLPDARYTVMDASNFFVDPVIFSGKIGAWYTLQQKKQVFDILEPSLRLEISESGINYDESWIKKGNLGSFKIHTSMAEMTQRSGCLGTPITIEMKGPDGTIYTTLGLTGDSPFNLVDIPVYYTPYDTGVVWETKRDQYPEGEYSFRAIATANGLSENYPMVGMTTTEWQTITLSTTDPKKKVEETPKPTPEPTPEVIVEITPPTTVPTTIQTTMRTARPTVQVTKTELARPPGADVSKTPPSSASLPSSLPATPKPTEPVASPLSWSMLGLSTGLSLAWFLRRTL